MTYSPSLAYLLDRLSGFSTNVFKLEPQGSNSAKANNIIRITLPANSLVNFRTFALHFKAEIESATGHGRLPNKIDSLIERVEVTFGGVQVASGNNYYNVLRHAKDAIMGDKTDTVLGHPDVVRAAKYAGADMTGPLENEAKYCVNHWEGFLGTVEPQIVDLSLLPECVVSIYLASNNVCIDANANTTAAFGTVTSGAAGAQPVYQLSEIYATIETVGMADGTYDAMVNQVMSKVGFLELPFKQYISFRDQNANMRFSVASQSLDRIWLVHHDENHNIVGGGKRVTGYKDVSGNVNFIDAKYSGEKYISQAFNFPENNAASTYQLQLNGALLPQYKASFEDMMQISKQSIEGVTENKHYLKTMKDNYAVFCVRLNLQNCERLRQLSGLDTRGIAMNGVYTIDSYTNTKPITVFAEITSVLKIGSGLQIAVDQ